jgi:hypothetical protein
MVSCVLPDVALFGAADARKPEDSRIMKSKPAKRTVLVKLRPNLFVKEFQSKAFGFVFVNRNIKQYRLNG